MKLDGLTLDAWFRRAAENGEGDLRGRGPEYKSQYENAVAKLTKYVHPEVTKGAIATDGGFLTDHGPAHIQKVILRAGEMLDGIDGCVLTPYEGYLLLMAIHFHDVGNTFGREKHEEAARRAMEWLGNIAGQDMIEKRVILQIARAHGGDVNGNKDTIGALQNEAKFLNFKVRPRLLAALVRFADELADDRERASRFMIDTDAVPAAARIFHQYAYALHSVHVDHEGSCVHLEFSLEEQAALETFKRGGEECYLLDYIFERTAKMHTERTYCMRYLRQFGLALDSVSVQIKVYGQPLEPLETIAYRLAESGYPSVSPAGIYDICPDLRQRQGWPGAVTGPALAERLRGGAGAPRWAKDE